MYSSLTRRLRAAETWAGGFSSDPFCPWGRSTPALKDLGAPARSPDPAEPLRNTPAVELRRGWAILCSPLAEYVYILTSFSNYLMDSDIFMINTNRKIWSVFIIAYAKFLRYGLMKKKVDKKIKKLGRKHKQMRNLIDMLTYFRHDIFHYWPLSGFAHFYDFFRHGLKNQQRINRYIFNNHYTQTTTFASTLEIHTNKQSRGQGFTTFLQKYNQNIFRGSAHFHESCMTYWKKIRFRILCLMPRA